MTLSHDQRGRGKTPGHVTAWRWFSGHSMDGRHRTDATWFYSGTRALREHDRPMRFHYLPRIHRAGIRTLASAITLAIIYGMFVARTLTEDMVMGALAALFGVGIAYARWRIIHAYHHRTVVRPLYMMTAHITGSDSALPHQITEIHKRYVHVPRNFRDDPNARIKLIVPVTYEAQKGSLARLNGIVNRRLGREFDIIPHWDAYPPHLIFTPAPEPPRSLTFADILPLIEKAKDSEIIIGRGTHNDVISIDLDSESPHVAINSGVGGGKSSLLRLIIIQLIRHGCEKIYILDIKRASQNAFKGIPGVSIHTTMESMINAAAEFRQEMDRRYSVLETDETAIFPRQVMIIEEQNSLFNYSRQYWSDYRNEVELKDRARIPKTCPLISDIGYALFMGRQSKQNVCSVYQRMSASAAGNGDMRDQYGAKLLMRHSPQAWSILVGTRPIPRASKIAGRAQFVLGEDIRAIQIAFISESDARIDALAHARADAVNRDPLMTVPADNAGADDEPAMTLRELVANGIIPMRYSTATRARTRADDFPEGKSSPIGRVYRPSDARAWYERRTAKRGK